MKDIKEKGNQIITVRDKWQCPFLLSASFQNLISYHGSYIDDGILYFQFSPKNKATELISQLETKQEPHIPALDFINAIDTFWRKANEARSQRNGRNEGYEEKNI